jgi:hypothetical protein
MTHVVGGPVWAARETVAALTRFLLFAVAAILAGALVGALLGSAFETPGWARVAFPLVAALLLIRELFFRRFPLPQVRAQVPSMLRGNVYAGPLLYGSILGTGILTYTPSALVHLYVLAVLAFAGPAQGIVAGAVFGAAYAASVLVLGKRTATAHPLEQATVVKQFVLLSRRPSVILAAAATTALVLLL